MVLGYCVKHKKAHEMDNPKLDKIRGRYMLKGKCKETGVKMTKFVSKDDASKFESYASYSTRRRMKYDAEKTKGEVMPEPVAPEPVGETTWKPEPVVAEAPKEDVKEEPLPETKEPEKAEVKEAVSEEADGAEEKPMSPAETEVMEASDWDDEGAEEEPEEEEPEEKPEEAEEFATEDEEVEDYDEEEPEEELVEAESPQPRQPEPRYPFRFPPVDRGTALTIGGLAALFSIPFIIKAISKREQKPK